MPGSVLGDGGQHAAVHKTSRMAETSGRVWFQLDVDVEERKSNAWKGCGECGECDVLEGMGFGSQGASLGILEKVVGGREEEQSRAAVIR